MATLHQRLISEISLSNPRLSPKEISDQIVILVENEILPRVLTSIRLPPLPSPLQVKREELMASRYGKLLKKRPLEEKVNFVQDLEKLRSEFDCGDLTNENLFMDVMNHTQTFIGQEVRYDVPIHEKPLSVEPEIIQKRLKSSPSLEIQKGITEKPQRLINFDSSINEKIARDPSFEKVVGKIESKIRRKYDPETLKIYFNFSLRMDTDHPEREKTIIHISILDYSFDEKMELWDKIEADIRDVIKGLGVTEPEKAAINRNMFTHIEPT